MTTVPPPNVALPQVLAAAAAAPTVTIAQPPPALAALPVGTTVEALVLPPPTTTTAPTTAPIPAAAPTPQTVTLHTALGDMAVRLPVTLPDKAQIELEVVRATAQQLTVRLNTVDGTPTLQFLAQSRTPTITVPAQAAPVLPAQTTLPIGPQPLPMGASWMPGGPAPFVQSGTISAVITQAPPVDAAPASAAPTPPSTPPSTPPVSAAPTPTATPGAAPAPAAPVPSPILGTLAVGTGSELSLKIVSVQLPGAPVATAPPSQPLVHAPGAPPVAPPPATPSAVPTPAPPPQPGPVVATAQGLAPAPPQPPTAAQPAPPLATVTGTVVAARESLPVVEIEDRQVQLNVRANLPVGTKIVFDVTAALPPRAGAPLALPLPAAAVPLSGPAGAMTGWPTLIEAVSVLQRSDPAAAQQLAQAIPDGGPRTLAAAISFVQAMRSGDARQWPGDTALRALERSSPRGAHLAATLSGEVAELASRARDTGAEWRALPIPWNAQGQIDRVALITRREGDSETDGAGGKKGGGTRFLIDLNLSRLGPLQLDGMFRQDIRAFDLVLRTKAALPDDMRRDLLGIFAGANAAMGLKGGLTFQVTKRFADPIAAGNTPDKSGLWA